ncbi:hypothetical protein HanRHA438_Chr07g0300921 [Helianthus annuus]|uniref:Uncharacterized protein n=1 Tax=Helianthus annuus TaxID=4232 RepID=A0A9K3NFU6_HELAN|nr:uncharacterized protein LOC110883850 [Helianthus annuus]KAF5798230.1 hypothetical protein HanXRQr2_Chr07g0290431 [Helianthus annuus]KAJ0549860.1 hypothetical protein HanHA300_Chr07g0238821 [Helianthus annuus]KAJ0556391.1 hypothetical protein HanIR_Chr07g0313281 [Helianthus annuus]KAJ0562818.1 hypothetical protein HanHA89_Chr07g0256031 [Helianthus annuus]KAJ0728192.1 hypothetical protein HanLR1_Chr07g0238821 [Helianthus annuus]
MVFGSIRSIIRPVSRALINARTTSSTPLYNNELHSHFGSIHQSHLFWRPASARLIQTLTDTRFPKRRPLDKPRRKRATLKPSGPYAWVKHVPGEPIPSNQPNVGSFKRRNEKKRIRLRKAFILAEKKKRKAELQEANRKKKNAKIERQMAAVARDRAWAERLAELQQIEEDKKNAAAMT